MAALRAVIRKSAITTGTALKTLLQLIAPANQRLKILEIGIGFHGVVNTNQPIQVDLVRQSTAGTMTSLTAVPIDEDTTETPQATAGHTATVEPTAGNVLATWPIHPQTAMIYTFPKGDEIVVKGGSRLGLCCTVLDGNSTTADVYIKYEE